MDRTAHEQNRLSWNAATVAHNRHKGDQARFLREGGSTLFSEEEGHIGHVEGLDLVHLQCNSGQDTLSIARKGARCVGVDISDEAVAFATRLSADSGIPARFVRADVLDWLATTDETFDVAFASYGTLGWLSALDPYFAGVQRILRPGGRWVFQEFHPVAFMYDDDGQRVFPYSSAGEPIHEPGVSDYVARSEGLLGEVADVAPFVNPHPSVGFAWSIGEVVTAALKAGLRLEVLVEYQHSNGWKPMVGAIPVEGRRWRTEPAMPLMYAVVARR